MSAELDTRIDAARSKLISLASQQIGYGNYKQIMREYQKLTLELINIMDVLNSQDDEVSPVEMKALKDQVAAAFAATGTKEGEE